MKVAASKAPRSSWECDWGRDGVENDVFFGGLCAPAAWSRSVLELLGGGVAIGVGPLAVGERGARLMV